MNTYGIYKRIENTIIFSISNDLALSTEVFQTHERRSPSVTLHSESDMCHFVELSETGKSLKGFLPMGLWSRVMAFLLNCLAIFSISSNKSNKGVLTWNLAHRLF